MHGVLMFVTSMRFGFTTNFLAGGKFNKLILPEVSPKSLESLSKSFQLNLICEKLQTVCDNCNYLKFGL